MNNHPDSALAVLRKINRSSLSSDKMKAKYALLMSQALDKNYIDTTSLDILQPAIDYYLRKGTADEKLRTYYYQGRIYQNRENNDSAMQSFMRGREYCGQASDTLTMANLLVAQGTILYTTYKFDDFIKVNLEAAELYRESGRPDYEVLRLQLYSADLLIFNYLYSTMYKVMYKVYFLFFLGSCACKSATSNSNSFTLASALLHRA